MTNDELIIEKIEELLTSLKDNRPNDRSEKDRHYAICISKSEDLMANFCWFIALE